MIVLAVDTGSIATGWSLYGSIYISSGVIRAPEHWSLEQRLARIDASVDGVIGWAIAEHGGIDRLILERVTSPSRKTRGAYVDPYPPGVCAGIWMAHYLITHGGPVSFVEAGEWQRPMLGRGHTKRTSTIRASMEAGRPVEDDNEADAVNMGAWWVARR
jgi:hypothetical protein